MEPSRSVPVITPNGANPASYLDPTSPESLLKKTKEMEVQSSQDQRFDVKVSPYEGFCAMPPLATLLNTPLTPLFLILLRVAIARRFF
jgi:hypothetical protein